MAMTKQQEDSYVEAIKRLVDSRTAVLYCISNINRPPESTYSSMVYKEIARLSDFSQEPINEIMKKVLIGLVAKTEAYEIELSNLRKLAV